MKKLTVFLFVFCSLVYAFPLDVADTRDILEGLKTGNKNSYIPALMQYGFTEQKINAWRFTRTNIEIYLQQLIAGMDGHPIPAPDMYIGNIKTVGEAAGELSSGDLDKINRFLNDFYLNSQNLHEIVKSENETKKQNNQIVSTISLDEIEDAIINYTPNSKTESYVLALCEYGFTDTQINAWRFTNTFIDQYYNQIYQVLSSKGYEKIPGPAHHIGTLRAVGEVKGNDLENIIKFLNNTYTIAQQMNDERIKELDKKVIERNDVIIIYGFNITYDGNGNTGGEIPVDETLYRSGTLIELKTSGSLEKEGYKFMGWSENKESSSWINSNKINIQRDTTLYAVWIDLDTLNQQTASQVIQQRQNTERSQNVGYTVYITKTGSKYHRANCKTLRNGSTSIGVNVAKGRGYAACKICNP